MESRIKDENADFLFQCILKLDSMEACYAFFEDLCTVQEIKTMAQRLAVAKLLSERRVYSDIVSQTGASTATISRVNRSLAYGNGGYAKVFNDTED